MELINGYPPAMRESIAMVERTRPARLMQLSGVESRGAEGPASGLPP